jgi:hypothetical protein
MVQELKGEGEFKRRLGVILTDDDLINKTINEARKEFPKIWMLQMTSGAAFEMAVPPEIHQWFKKWFGEEVSRAK